MSGFLARSGVSLNCSQHTVQRNDKLSLAVIARAANVLWGIPNDLRRLLGLM